MSRRGTAIDVAVDHATPPPSARAFGYVMAVVLLLAAGWAWGKQHAWAHWLGLVGVLLALAGEFAPFLLAPLNRLWMAFGHLLGRIVSPLIMGLIFFGVLTPIALLARLRGVDPMKRRFDPAASSYWIVRDPPGPDPGTMDRQF